MGRMDGSQRTEHFIPDVSLVSMTYNPLETIFCIWWGSRHSSTIRPSTIYLINKYHELGDITSTPALLKDLEGTAKVLCEAYPEHCSDDLSDIDNAKNVIKSIVEMVIDSDLPPLESVLFTFEVDNATVAWREQLVRDRKAGYWTQTSRTLDLSTMDVNINPTIGLLGGGKAEKIYKDTVDDIREAYSRLMELGVPAEDIRLQPTSMVHRVYWFITLRQLLHVAKKRSDWIAQATLWSPIISGVLSSVTSENKSLGVLLKKLVGKPAVELSEDEYGSISVSSHKYDVENLDRYEGRDPQPCDPLWLAYKGLSYPEEYREKHADHYYAMKSIYRDIWPIEYLRVLGWSSDGPLKEVAPYDP